MYGHLSLAGRVCASMHIPLNRRLACESKPLFNPARGREEGERASSGKFGIKIFYLDNFLEDKFNPDFPFGAPALLFAR